jgi:hypothetical protein
MNSPELIIFILLYTFASTYCGICLAWAAGGKPMPHKCDDSIFETTLPGNAKPAAGDGGAGFRL